MLRGFHCGLGAVQGLVSMPVRQTAGAVRRAGHHQSPRQALEIMTYRGFVIWTSRNGGKAGAGLNKTGSVQVRESLPQGGYLLVKQFRYGVGHALVGEALFKARQHVDKLLAHRERYNDASAN